jgi:diacylglycerol kinase (ATP)
MKPNKFSIKKRMQSFRHAFNGVKILVKEEHNAWIHLTAMLFTVVLGFICKVSKTEWLALIFAMGLVLAMELINTALENLANYSSPGMHPLVKKVKDLSAAAVLIAALTALSIGLLIFIPKLLASLTL